jgi:hypothetical protein
MPKRGTVTMEIRQKNGVWEKRCTICGEWKPIKDGFYTRKSYRVNNLSVRLPRPQCKLCTNQVRGKKYYPNAEQHGLIEYKEISHIVDKVIRRIGQAEFARRSKIASPKLWAYRKGKTRKIHRITATRMLLVCQDVIESGEVKTHNEIWQGTRLNNKGHL